MLNLDKSKKYLLACSFGPDSMALFGMLLKENFNFEVAHVNYNLRPESSIETANLINFCNSRKIKIYVFENKENIGKNVEEKCREIRYDFFRDVYLKNEFDYLLIAHNEDDNIETYLLQKKRKNLVNYYGISCKTTLFSMNVVRPVLGIPKAELLKYCIDERIPFSIDSTNLEDNFERNKIRHSVVEKMSFQEREVILKEIQIENKRNESYKNKANEFVGNSINELLKIEDPVFSFILTNMAREIKPSFELSSRLSKEIRKCIISDKPNIVLKFKDNFVFVKEYDKFYFKYLEENQNYSLTVELGDIVDNQYIYFDTNRTLEKQNLKPTDFPITIRNSESGDEIKVGEYFVKIRRLFIDWKMPLTIRKKWPIFLTRNNQIVYVPRYQKDFKKSSDSNFYVKI